MDAHGPQDVLRSVAPPSHSESAQSTISPPSNDPNDQFGLTQQHNEDDNRFLPTQQPDPGTTNEQTMTMTCSIGKFEITIPPVESRILLGRTPENDAQQDGFYKSFLLYDQQRGRFQACSRKHGQIRLGPEGVFYKDLFAESTPVRRSIIITEKGERLPVEGEVELFDGDKLHLCPVAGPLNNGGLGGWTPYDGICLKINAPGLPRRGGTPSPSDTLSFNMKMLLMDTEVGAVIGREGSNVHKIEREKSSRVLVSPRWDLFQGAPFFRARSVLITAPTIENCAQTLDLVMASSQGPTFYFVIPGALAGRVLGIGGSSLQDLSKVTNLRLSLLPEPVGAGQLERILRCSGTKDQITRALPELVQRLGRNTSHVWPVVLPTPQEQPPLPPGPMIRRDHQPVTRPIGNDHQRIGPLYTKAYFKQKRATTSGGGRAKRSSSNRQRPGGKQRKMKN